MLRSVRISEAVVPADRVAICVMQAFKVYVGNRLENRLKHAYNVYMANRTPISSAPLFGASTPSQIREIQARIRSATAKHVRSQESARALLLKVGALSEDDAGN